MYNANTETEQVKTLQDLETLLKNIDFKSNKKIIFAGDLNFFFDKALEAKGGNPVLKKKSLAKTIKIMEQYDLVDIWRLRNSKKKRFTFRQKQFSGFIQRRLDYIFISNNIQEDAQKCTILPSLASDHSPIAIALSSNIHIEKGPGLWKFNNSLIFDQKYVDTLKLHIIKQQELLALEQNYDDQFKWEILKYEIRNFTVQYCKTVKKEQR